MALRYFFLQKFPEKNKRKVGFLSLKLTNDHTDQNFYPEEFIAKQKKSGFLESQTSSMVCSSKS